MAVARMLKVTVLGYRSVVDDVVDALQRAGVMQVASQPFDLPSMEVSPDDPRLRDVDEYAADASFLKEFLGRYHTPGQPLSAFISEKFHLSTEEFLALEPDTHFKRLYREAVTIADRLANGAREIARLKALVSDLQPWQDLRLEIQDWRGTEHVMLFTGTVPASRGPAIRQSLREAVPEVSVEELGPVGSRQAWVVMAHRSCVDDVRAVLAGTDFSEVSFPELSDYPAEEIAEAEARIAELVAESADLTQHATDLAAEHYGYSVSVYEALLSARQALTVRGGFARTERAFAITGWVRAAHAEQLKEALAPWSGDLDLTLEEPASDEVHPIALDNPPWLRPFEVLTDLYGVPNPGEVDPTPLLAPFFILFFGICISDVGYGAMIIAGSQLIKRRLDVAPGVKRFMDLLTYGGISAMFVGVLFGSYFAIPIDKLPSFLQSLQVLDPLNELTTFLIVCIVLGIAEVFFGVFVSAFESFRRGDPATAIFEPLSTIFFFSMIAVAVVVPSATRWALVLGLGITMLMQGRAIAVAFGDSETRPLDRGLGIGWLVVTIGALLALAFTGDPGAIWAFLVVTVVGLAISRTVRRSVVALLGGAYGVYGMSAFIGDVLSYTRLAALGLSGALVGWVFNILAGLVWGGADGLFAQGGVFIAFGVLVIAASIAVFVVGHTFNVVINLLGAFVHPARLQFVEFFSKFYEGGGKVFAPLKFATKNVVLNAGSSRQEGGA